MFVVPRTNKHLDFSNYSHHLVSHFIYVIVLSGELFVCFTVIGNESCGVWIFLQSRALAIEVVGFTPFKTWITKLN